MSKKRKISVEELLSSWDDAKKRKTEAEKECTKYRNAIGKYMDVEETNTVSSETHTVTRRSSVRQTIAQKNVPSDIWNKYATRSTFETYHLKTK